MRHLLPVLVFAAAEILSASVAAGTGSSPWLADTWTKWDSFQYLEIARDGYVLERCGDRFALLKPDDWCGNAAWFPGYAFAIRALSLLLTPATAAVLVAHAFFLATLVLVDRAFLADRAPVDRGLALATLAFFPGAIFYQAAFPTSIVIFALALTIAAVSRERWALAGAAGALVSFSYTTGVLVTIVIAWAAFRSERRVRALALGLVPPVLAALLVLVVMRHDTGHWDAFALVQSHYGHGMNFPWGTWWAKASRVVGDGNTIVKVTAVQSILVLVLVVLGLGQAWKSPEPHARPIALLVLVYWLFPLVMGKGVSLYRAEALLSLTSVLLVPVAPRVRAGIVAACVLLHVAVASLYFVGVLV